METMQAAGTRSSARSDAATRAALERYLSNITDQEVANEFYNEMYHDDLMLEFPQGGERIVGRANVRAMREAYPADVTLTTRRLRGGGDLWVSETMVTYDGGPPSHGVAIFEFRDGKVVHETIYWGEPWQPPAWRAQWVESIGPVDPAADPSAG